MNTEYCISGFTFYSVSPYFKQKRETYRGPDAGEIFLEKILAEEQRCKKLIEEANEEMDITEKQEKQFRKATECYICKNPFKEDQTKVRDHCHFTGKYRGAAHEKCNLALRKVKDIPVFFHNLSGYDAHLIFQNLTKIKDIETPTVIAKSMEKYVTFSIGDLKFKDSLNFLLTSLDKLVANLKAKALKEKNDKGLFASTWRYFKDKWGHLPETAFQMLTRKGVYPYSYMDSHEKFDEKCLPGKEHFYNDLSKEDITEEEYTFAKEVWNIFNLENMGQLHDLYMETDVMLLADVFETFRDVSLKNYKLDPAHFTTAPSLSWTACLKQTGIQLEIPRDPDMHLLFDRGLTGGISMVANHYARANNPQVEGYEEDKEKSYIGFFDCNNQVRINKNIRNIIM